MVYEGHARYLPRDHPLRDGIIGLKPPSLKASDWFSMWETNGYHPPQGMKRLSIFHRLPYWSNLLVNHLLDPMHIFKNVACGIWQHLVGERDTRGAREDLQELGKMRELWPQVCDARVVLPKAPWIFTKKEEAIVKREISSFRTPTGHMHCLKDAFTKDKKLVGLKSHDWHKFLQV